MAEINDAKTEKIKPKNDTTVQDRLDIDNMLKDKRLTKNERKEISEALIGDKKEIKIESLQALFSFLENAKGGTDFEKFKINIRSKIEDKLAKLNTPVDVKVVKKVTVNPEQSSVTAPAQTLTQVPVTVPLKLVDASQKLILPTEKQKEIDLALKNANDLFGNGFNITSKSDYEAFGKAVEKAGIKMPEWKNLNFADSTNNDNVVSGKALSFLLSGDKVEVYFGDPRMNESSGPFTMKWGTIENGNAEKGTVNSKWDNAENNNTGVIKLKDGDKFEGKYILDDKGITIPNGEGKLTTKNGTIKGKFEKGKINGKGTFTSINGETSFDGIFKDSKPTEGKFISKKDLLEFNGKFVDFPSRSNISGKVIINGESYEGKFNEQGAIFTYSKKGEKVENGTITFVDGKKTELKKEEAKPAAESVPAARAAAESVPAARAAAESVPAARAAAEKVGERNSIIFTESANIEFKRLGIELVKNPDLVSQKLVFNEGKKYIIKITSGGNTKTENSDDNTKIPLVFDKTTKSIDFKSGKFIISNHDSSIEEITFTELNTPKLNNNSRGTTVEQSSETKEILPQEKSLASAPHTIAKALQAIEEFTNSQGQSWKIGSEGKQFMDQYAKLKSDITKTGIKELFESKAGNDVKVINKFLKDKGFSIELQDSGKDSLYVASVFKQKVMWESPGKTGKIILDSGKEVDAVMGMKNVEKYSSKGNTIYSLKTQDSTEVYMMPFTGKLTKDPLELNKIIKEFDESKSLLTKNKDGLNFPMVDFRENGDISWLKGAIIGNSTISEAKYENAFQMDEKGALAQAAVVIAATRGFNINSPDEIKGPMLVWFKKDGVITFGTKIGEENMKKPKIK